MVKIVNFMLYIFYHTHTHTIQNLCLGWHSPWVEGKGLANPLSLLSSTPVPRMSNSPDGGKATFCSQPHLLAVWRSRAVPLLPALLSLSPLEASDSLRLCLLLFSEIPLAALLSTRGWLLWYGHWQPGLVQPQAIASQPGIPGSRSLWGWLPTWH